MTTVTRPRQLLGSEPVCTPAPADDTRPGCDRVHRFDRLALLFWAGCVLLMASMLLYDLALGLVAR